MEETVLQWISHYGYLGIFFLLMFGIIGLPIPDETLMLFSGYLASKGELSLLPTIASGFLGSISGITVNYILGRTGGHYLIQKYGHLLRITRERISRVHDWLEHAGRWGLLFGYFIPGVRHLAPLVAGTSQMKYPVFAAFAYAGGLMWSISFTTAGFFLGREWKAASVSVRRWLFTGAAAAGGALIVSYVLYRWYRMYHKSR